MSRTANFHAGRGQSPTKMTPQQKAERNAASKERHDELTPMKETIRSQGASFATVAGHLNKNSKILFGEQLTKNERLAWAVKKHAEDPENFLKNIGFKR